MYKNTDLEGLALFWHGKVHNLVQEGIDGNISLWPDELGHIEDGTKESES